MLTESPLVLRLAAGTTEGFWWMIVRERGAGRERAETERERGKSGDRAKTAGAISILRGRMASAGAIRDGGQRDRARPWCARSARSVSEITTLGGAEPRHRRVVSAGFEGNEGET
jgi:hypothetical protein